MTEGRLPKSAARSRPPFSQSRFRDLPEVPRRAHCYFDAGREEVIVNSAPLGPVRIHYRTHGSGPPLLLIHGLMTSSYSWRYVLEGLGERYTVIAPDLPGSGRSEVPTGGSYRAAALATWIGEFQGALGIEGCLAIGNSLGGYLCMRRALDAPASFGRLVNIHSPALPQIRLRALHAALSVPGLIPALAWSIGRSPERWAHRNVHYHDETLKSREEAREYGRPLATRPGARAFLRSLQETLAPADFARFIAELERRRRDGGSFPVPLLLLYATTDRMVPPATGRVLHELIPGSRLAWLDGSSHFAQVDTPEAVVEIVLDFFDQPDDVASTGGL
jgi:pimeloyl-ACP methyl ester carboxylesterase